MNKKTNKELRIARNKILKVLFETNDIDKETLRRAEKILEELNELLGISNR